MVRLGVAAAMVAVVALTAPTAQAAEYPSNWQNCKPNVVGTKVLCDALVTLKAPDAGTARNMCRTKITEQAQAAGYLYPKANGAEVQKRKHGRFWCRVFLSFQA